MKLGFNYDQIGRLTLRTFKEFYKCYKDNFDLELRLKNANMTYQEAYNKSLKQEEWI